jgi:hypothetical protein
MAASWTLPVDGLRHVATVSERYSAYNVEMVEVIGGRFWKPYASVDAERAAKTSGGEDDTEAGSVVAPSEATPAGMPVDLYEQRPPVDLADPKLRRLAAALGPSYCRVSGTWSNDVYFSDGSGPVPSEPPDGFGGVLTAEQWQGVVDFCAAVDASLVTSFAVSPGVRAADGSWLPDQARALLSATAAMGGRIAAAELMNEPTFAAMGHAPDGYDAAWFGRDVAAFRALVAEEAPDLVVLGPGSVGEGGRSALLPEGFNSLSSELLLAETPGAFDVFSYHFYGAISERVATTLPRLGTSIEAALSADWLTRTDAALAFYAELRDRHAPGAPIWCTETAQAAAGADRWAATFADTFRFLYQLGSLARGGVDAVFHNTLCASDYGLLDEATLDPRPNYWAALLWHRLMGTAVFDAGPPPPPDVYAFVHSNREGSGHAALLINASAHPVTVALPGAVDRYCLTAPAIDARQVLLNGTPLALDAGRLPGVRGEPAGPGETHLPPRSITFFTTSAASDPASTSTTGRSADPTNP